MLQLSKSSDHDTDDSASPELFPTGGRELKALPRESGAACADESAPEAEEAIRQSKMCSDSLINYS